MLAESLFIHCVHVAICDRLWENPAYGIFCENRVWCIFDKLYPRANSPASLRPLTRFAWELVHFVHDLATRMEIEKLRSERVAMYAYSVSIYYAWMSTLVFGQNRTPRWQEDVWNTGTEEVRHDAHIHCRQSRPWYARYAATHSVSKMFACVNYGQIWNWNRGESCSDSERNLLQLINTVLPNGESSFLDLQEV